MEPDPQAGREAPETDFIPHRRRRLSAWQKTPKQLKIAIAACLGVLAISLAVSHWIIGWSQSRSESKLPSEPVKVPSLKAGTAFDEVASRLQPFDLELSGTALNPATRRIEGTVRNKSQRTYTNIRITFALPSPDLRAQDQTTVVVDKLDPQAKAKFASDVLPKSVRQWALINTTATPAAPERAFR
jgi:hypothetical protein